MSQVRPSDLPTQTFAWGTIKWLVTPDRTPGAGLTFGEVVLLPGRGHDRHNHPDAEEVLYVLSGEGLQMVADGEPFPVRAGDTVYVPRGIYHSTQNTSWSPMHLLAIYNPGGPERQLEHLPDFAEVPPGAVPSLIREVDG